MVAGLVGRKSRSTEKYKPTSVSKGVRNRSFDDRRLPPNAHCSPERRYALQPQFCPSESSVYSEVSTREAKNQPYVAGILDSFTCLCFGSTDEMMGSIRERTRSEKSKSRKSSTTRNRVVYPIASYPARLNSKTLVNQRRKSLPHQFFRPVSEDEMPVSNRPPTAWEELSPQLHRINVSQEKLPCILLLGYRIIYDCFEFDSE
jgi:hypothetical protein